MSKGWKKDLDGFLATNPGKGTDWLTGGVKKTKKKERITDLEAMVLAGMFALSNGGGNDPDPSDVDCAKKMRYPSVDNSVATFCGGICESDEMLEAFEKEGRSWYRRLKKMSRAEVKASWPEGANLMWGEGASK